MAFYSNFHHSNHPNFKQPYTSNRPSRRSNDGGGGGGSSSSLGGRPSHHHSDMMSGGGGGGGSRSAGGVGNGSDGGGYQGGNGTNTLWMGNIDNSMDENFIKSAFNQFGINVHNIKIIRNKENGFPLGYGFVSFDNSNTANDVLREMNGKKMPIVGDDKRFFLKRANRTMQRFSIFVGNLTPEVDDEILLSAFMSYYPSVSSAKVITNEGQSKGFGFVSFEDEYDYYTALNQPNMMLGQNPISVSKARHNNQNKTNPRFPDNENTNIRTRRHY